MCVDSGFHYEPDRTLCGRWPSRWAGISAMALAMVPSSPWEEAL